MIVQIDSREKNNESIKKYFDEIGKKYIVSKLIAGDYMNPQNTKNIIELKHSHNDGLLELAGNLCNSLKHNRFINEIKRAREIGCENFYILIVNDKIKTVEDIANWTNKNTQVKGSTLLKVMTTMKERYGVKFVIVPKKEMGSKIIELLGGK